MTSIGRIIILVAIAIVAARAPSASQTAVVADPANERVVFVDTQTGVQVPVQLGAGGPRDVLALLAVPRGEFPVLYVVRSGRAAIAIVDPHRSYEVREIALEFQPTQLLALPDGRHIWAWGDGFGVLVDSETDLLAGPVVVAPGNLYGVVGGEVLATLRYGPNGYATHLAAVDPFTGRGRAIPLETSSRLLALDDPRGRAILNQVGGGLSVVDLATGQTTGRIHTRYTVEQVVIAGDGRRAYAVDEPGDVLELDLLQFRVIQRVPIKLNSGTKLQLAPSGSYLYGATDGAVVQFDTRVGQVTARFAWDADSLVAAPDDWTLLAFSKQANGASVLRVLDLRFRAVDWFDERFDGVPMATFSGDGQYAYIADRYSLRVKDRDAPFGGTTVALSRGDEFRPEQIVTMGTSTFVASDHNLAIIDLDTLTLDSVVPFPDGSVPAGAVRLAGAPNGRSLFFAAVGLPEIHRFDVDARQWKPFPFGGPDQAIRAIAVSQDGSTLAVAYSTPSAHRLAVVRATSGGYLSDVDIGDYPANSIAIEPAGRRIAVASEPYGGNFWRLIDIDGHIGRILHRTDAWTGELRGFAAVSISSGGTTYSTVSGNHSSCASDASYLIEHQHGGSSERRLPLRRILFEGAFVDEGRRVLVGTDAVTKSVAIVDLMSGALSVIPLGWEATAIAPAPNSITAPPQPAQGALTDTALLAARPTRLGLLFGSTYGDVELASCSHDAQSDRDVEMDAVALTSDAREAVVVAHDRRLFILEPATGRHVASTLLPYSVSQIVVSADNALAFLRPMYGNGIGVFDLTANEFVATILEDLNFGVLKAARDPRYLYAGDGRGIAVIDSVDGRITRYIAVPDGPYAFASNPVDGSLYVAVSTSSGASRLDSLRDDGSVRASTTLFASIGDIEASSDGKVYASIGKAVVELDADLVTMHTFVGNDLSPSVELSADERYLYASSEDHLDVFDLSHGSRRMVVPKGAIGTVLAVACGRDCPAAPPAPIRTPANLFATPTPRETPTPIPWPTPAKPSQPYNTMAVSSLRLPRGGDGSIAVSYYGGAFIAGFQQQLSFDPRAGVVAWVDGQPDCETAWDHGTFTFLPLGCMPGVDCSGLQAVVTNDRRRISDPFNPVVVYECRVRASSDAESGRYPIHQSSPTLDDWGTQRPPISLIDGEVLVGEEADPPPILVSGPETASCGAIGGFASEFCVGSAVTDPGGRAELRVDLLSRTNRFKELWGRLRLPRGVTVGRDTAGAPQCRIAEGSGLTNETLQVDVTDLDCGDDNLCATIEFWVANLTAPVRSEPMPLIECILEAAASAVPGSYALSVTPRHALGIGEYVPLPIASSTGGLLIRAAATPTSTPVATATATPPSPATPTYSPTGTATPTAEPSSRGGNGCSMAARDDTSRVMLALSAVAVAWPRRRRLRVRR